MEKVNNFIIKPKPFMLVLALLFIAVSIGLTVIFALTILNSKAQSVWLWFLMILPAVILIGSIFPLYAYKKEKLIYKDGVFTYITAFNKEQSAPAESIKEVTLCMQATGRRVEDIVEFIDNEGKTVIKFTDYSLKVFQTHIFRNALNKLEIDYRFKPGERYGDE